MPFTFEGIFFSKLVSFLRQQIYSVAVQEKKNLNFFKIVQFVRYHVRLILSECERVNEFEMDKQTKFFLMEMFMKHQRSKYHFKQNIIEPTDPHP